MAQFLVHITHGPEQPTRAALGFLVAKAAIDEGHEASLFLAGDAVQLIREPVLDSLQGLGTGSLRENFDAIVSGGGRFFLSGMSSKARGSDRSRHRRQAGRVRDAERARQAVARSRQDVYVLGIPDASVLASARSMSASATAKDSVDAVLVPERCPELDPLGGCLGSEHLLEECVVAGALLL